MIKNPSQSISYLKYLKKILPAIGLTLILLFQGSFPLLAITGSLVNNTDELQQKTVTGRIIDANKIALAGVNVVEKGTTNGVATGSDGKYSINVSSNQAVLVFSFVGFSQQELPVGNLTAIDVTLTETTTGLDEIVVIGYGTVKKRDITGAVASVRSQELMANAPTTIQKALQGKTAGVLVTTGNTVNSTPTIRIRGDRSISATNDPLFVIDGIPVTGGMETINPNDVESVEILKDASATAIYGSRGANGVIIVTTKKGEAGKISVEYEGYVSISKIDRFRYVRNAAEYSDFVRDANRDYTYDGNGGYQLATNSLYGSVDPAYNFDLQMPYFTQDPSGYVLQSMKYGWVDGVWDPSQVRDFNWQMAGFRNQALSQNHTISIRGGSENTKVYVSGSYMDLTGVQVQSYRKRYTLRMNLDQTLGKLITMGGNINFSYVNSYNGIGIGSSWTPLGNPYYSPGGSGNNGVGGDVTKLGDPALGIIPNPTGELLQTNPFFDFEGRKGIDKSNRLNANLYLDVTIYKGLTYRANFGTDLNIGQSQSFASKYSTTTALGEPRAAQNLTFQRGYTFENILAYNKTIQSHSLGVTFVQSTQKYVSEPVSSSGMGLPIENQIWYSLGTASTQTASSSFSQWTMMSWMGRINYGFKGKYLFTGSIRYDGSSRLAEGQKWVAFPSAAIAWRISDENFLKDIAVISNLKLRAGYGVTGNSAINPYQTVGTIASSRYTWGKTTGILGYAPNSLSNSALSWERTAQYNVGLDFGILKDRISGTIDMYLQNTYDLLMTRSLPRVSGFGSIMQNIGETENSGLEISLKSINFQTTKFRWTTDLQVAANRQKIKKLASGLNQDLGNFWFVGYPIDTYYDYVAAPYVWGYSKEDMDELAKFNANGSNFKPGDLRMVDLNGDYKITAADDRQIRGSKIPKWTASLANTIEYGPFDFYIFMFGMVGQTVYWDPGIGYAARYNTVKVDYWTPTNTKTKWLQPHQGMEIPSNITAMYYWKGDFLKISDISVGYTLPNELTRKVGIQRTRFYAKVQNPFMFTDFEGNDPEGAVGQTRSGNTLSTYGSDNPTLRTYMFGINLTF
jgi:TonB-linked SusC/RagA family outer membrane protein